MKNRKSDWWRMRADQTDKVNIAKLKKKMGVRSESDAVRRAVAMALQAAEPRPDQSASNVAMTV